MLNQIPKYSTILSATVRYDNRLSPLARLIYSEILYLSKGKGFCDTPNKYFAELYDRSITQISATLRQLSYYRYIKLIHNPELSFKDQYVFGGNPLRLIFPQVDLELVFSAKK
jgi:hypothetical protein